MMENNNGGTRNNGQWKGNWYGTIFNTMSNTSSRKEVNTGSTNMFIQNLNLTKDFNSSLLVIKDQNGVQDLIYQFNLY